MALEEDKITGNWKERSVCMGEKKTCSFPGLINHHHKFIISFAEDEAGNVQSVQVFSNVFQHGAKESNVSVVLGELYFLATAYPSTASPFGTVFKFMDPSRWSIIYS